MHKTSLLLVLVTWACAGLFVAAQPPGFPQPVGAARIPEPMSVEGHGKRLDPGSVVPGPITPLQAPPGPPPDLWLPEQHANAFPCESWPTEQAFFATFRTQALKRDRLGGTTVFNLDPSASVDSGTPFNSNNPTIIRFKDVNRSMQTGFGGTVGYLEGNQSLELSGYYLFESSRRVRRDIPNQLSAPFFNFPVGFEGNSGLWLQADVGTVQLTTAVGNLEVNYRLWNSGVGGFDLLLGLRYMYVRDKLQIITDDDGRVIVDLNGNPDPLRQATYAIDSRNNLITLQFGGEYADPLPVKALSFIWLGATGKAAVGPNLIRKQSYLYRGDGLLGFDRADHATGFGQIYDVGAFIDFHFLERGRIRLGYNVLWVTGVAVSDDQVEFNLERTRFSHRGSYLFHGPQLEFQFLF